MINANRTNRLLLLLACATLFAGTAQAQRANVVSRKATNASPYQVSREVSLQGTVVKFTPDSQTPPLGAHVLIQTPAGTTVDVHLGDARLLQLSQMTITPGSSIRIIGESLPYGKDTMFFARLVQQGTQVVAVRSPSGAPLWPAGARGNPAALATVNQGGAR